MARREYHDSEKLYCSFQKTCKYDFTRTNYNAKKIIFDTIPMLELGMKTLPITAAITNHYCYIYSPRSHILTLSHGII